MNTKAVIVYTFSGKAVDLEIPMDIPADTLIKALYSTLEPSRPCPNFIRSDNPSAMLFGDATVDSFGLRDGSTLYLI